MHEKLGGVRKKKAESKDRFVNVKKQLSKKLKEVDEI